ncbi:MAG: cytochrome C oxidase subunit IV family protein [Rhodothermales bacterium]
MADHPHDTSAHDPADHGHHGHHILSSGILLKVFGALIFLTILTVVLGLMERSGTIHLGALSVPVALGIAGVKATLVAMFFMALKYDNKVNALAFSLSLVFLAVFFIFTFLDTGFRDTFDERSATAIDEVEMQELQLQQRTQELQPAFEAQPLVLPGDTALIGAPPAP